MMPTHIMWISTDNGWKPMAIAKRPSDAAIEDAFIKKASAAPSAPRKRVGVMVRFDPDLLEHVDAAAKKRGISRAAWLQYAASLIIEKGK